ncbi:MAG: DUF72 domain-containing protein [Candidatus Methylomirabilales bacterium]
MGGRAYIGTSGWSYPHWRGVFYPRTLPGEAWLNHYVTFFETVELNNTFYQLPETATFRQWYREAPERFVFAVKGSRFITHMKKLQETREASRRFLRRVAILNDKLGPVLFQLPPRFRCNPERLASFTDRLPTRYRYAFEFRDATWFVPEVYVTLKTRGLAFCIFSLKDLPCPEVITASFVYLRFHGPGAKYGGKYSEEELRVWAGRIRAWLKKGLDVYAYFNNDERGYAVANAVRLRELTG